LTGGSNQGGDGKLTAVTVGEATARIWGMTSAQRLSRIYGRVGLAEATAPSGQDVVVVDAGWVFDESLIRALAGRPNVALVDDAGRVVAYNLPRDRAAAGLAPLAEGKDLSAVLGDAPRLTAMELGSAYNSELRKREPPVLERLTPDTVDAVEKRLFKGSYKGVTDLVTKYVWPAPARVVTRWCALAKLTPNMVTFASFLMVLAAFWLFWTGHYGWGLVCAWIMTFLDTVDGKLARVTLTSSKWGNVFDHSIDLIHPPFWWWAWYVGLGVLGFRRALRTAAVGRHRRRLCGSAGGGGDLPGPLQGGNARLAAVRQLLSADHRAPQPEPAVPDRHDPGRAPGRRLHPGGRLDGDLPGGARRADPAGPDRAQGLGHVLAVALMKVGVVHNPRSHANMGRDAEYWAPDDVMLVKPATIEALEVDLRAFAARGSSCWSSMAATAPSATC
jgi:hypothetical protein